MSDMTDDEYLQAGIWLLGPAARQFETNTGRKPTTIAEIGDHWYEMSDHIVVHEHIDEDGVYQPAQTVFEVDAPDHCLQCIWLRRVGERPRPWENAPAVWVEPPAGGSALAA
jgi:hypothetical protein